MTQGDRVKEIRKSLGLTLEKFGQRIGVGKSTISDIENGRRSLSEHMTKSICREFGVDYMWLTTLGKGKCLLIPTMIFWRPSTGSWQGKMNFIRNCCAGAPLLYRMKNWLFWKSRLISLFLIFQKKLTAKSCQSHVCTDTGPVYRSA